MKTTKKHVYKKWEVSMIEFKTNAEKKYKVTRRLPELRVAESRMFNSKKEVREQFEKWLS